MKNSNEKRNVIVLVNTDWFFLMHRKSIAKAYEDLGYNIVVASKNTGRKQEIIDYGFDFINIDFDRKGTNLYNELKTLNEIYKIYKVVKPILVYQVTIKPIIYGTIAAKFLNINTINTICGLGYVFSKKETNILRIIASKAYKNAVNYKKAHTFFENKDDQQMFVEKNILKQVSKSTVVNGAGVNLNLFKINDKVNLNNSNNKIIVTLATRMLWDKGVREFVDSAKLLKEKYKNQLEFRLYGMIDEGNPEAVPESYLNNIEIEGYLKWFGFTSDMIEVYEASDIFVLPSYYGEGLPTVLAEACAMRLPIVTTDSVGCRECVDEGVNGFKVEIKSTNALSKAIEKLINDKDLRLKMGKSSREKAIKDFDQEKIVAQYLKVFKSMTIN